jgi:hypothetical protein
LRRARYGQQVADDFCDPGPSDFGTEHSRFLDEFGNFGSDLLKWELACACWSVLPQISML